jgi:hypothetical protein
MKLCHHVIFGSRGDAREIMNSSEAQPLFLLVSFASRETPAKMQMIENASHLMFPRMRPAATSGAPAHA